MLTQGVENGIARTTTGDNDASNRRRRLSLSLFILYSLARMPSPLRKAT